MGLTVTLESESGAATETVRDPRNLLKNVLPEEGSGFPWAETIIWFGDTTFNCMQADRLRCEWARFIEGTRDPDTASLLQQIDVLLQRCVTGTHLYVKFWGD
jgi:hypothetical protein